MMRAAIVTIVLMIGGSSGGAAAAAHQAAPASPPPAAAPDAQGVSAGEIQRLYDAYALVQAQEALQLSDEQYGKFVTRLKGLQEARRRNQQARGKILQDLRRLTAPDVVSIDESAIRDRLRMLRDQEDRGMAELRKATDAVDEVLDVRQQARFRLFEEQVERRKLDLLMRARRNAAAQNPRRGRGSKD
jgi:hypothetical protein